MHTFAVRGAYALNLDSSALAEVPVRVPPGAAGEPGAGPRELR